jgi:hypothetical protein
VSQFDITVATALVPVLATIYGDDCLYTPAGGAALAVRAVCAFHNDAVSLGPFDMDVRAPGHEARVGQALVPTKPAIGDGFQVLTGRHVGTYTIKDIAEDLERAEWLVDLGG